MALQGLWVFSVGVLVSAFLVESEGVSYNSQPPAPYAPQQQYYEKPQYYETIDTPVDYREANATRQCGILPAVHRNEYGYERERLAFGEQPWLAAVLDTYQVYLAAGGIISPRHILTSAKALQGKTETDLVVRIGEYDLQSDHNYLEAYRNYEIAVSKIHRYHAAPKAAYSGYGYAPRDSYDQYNYDVVILELYEDIDFDLYPQAEPVCLPEYYPRSNTYYQEKTYSYNSYGGYGGQQGQQQQQEVPSQAHPEQRTQIGVNADLECWVAGWKQSPVEKISFEQERADDQSQSQYPSSSSNSGYSYKPSTYYDYYEQSRTPRRAKVSKVYGYDSYASPQYPQKPSYGSGYGYEKPYKTENWEAEYYYDACHADEGSPIYCLVEAKYEQQADKYYSPPPYQPEYKPSYQPEYKPSYQPEYKPSYQPEYKPSYQPEYKPSYQPRHKRQAAPYQSQPAYPQAAPYQSQPAYPQAPAYQKPAYQAPYQPEYKPAYQPPAYTFPAIAAESQVEDYRRAVIVGVVSYGTECTYTPYTETKKITVTPVRDILDWILTVLHTKAY